MRFLAAILGALLFAAPALAEDDAAAGLPDAKGRDETVTFCGACHSMNIVRQQGMTRPRWDETLDWMVERHAMPKLEGEDRELILDYLALAFPPKKRERPNPFLK
jgi:cytochrome c553